jgi:hypothetical protein
MIPEFSELDIQIIQKELQRKSYADIGFLIDKTEEEVRAAATLIADSTGVIPYQHILDARKKTREIKPARQKKKQPVIISRIIDKQTINPDRFRKKEKRWGNREVDWSKMVTVKIDHRTSVMARRDQDPREVREKYFANQKKYKNQLLSDE